MSTFSPAAEPVPKKRGRPRRKHPPFGEKYPRDQSKRRASYQPKITTNGRPTKRTPEVEKALIAAIEIGAPFRVACLSCAISEDAFTEWRRKDPDFARAGGFSVWEDGVEAFKENRKRMRTRTSARRLGFGAPVPGILQSPGNSTWLNGE